MKRETQSSSRTIEIVLDETLEITLFTKGDHQEAKVDVDLRQLTAESVLSLMRHGIKQKLNDAASTTKGTRADKVKAARAVAKAIAENTVRARATGLSPAVKLACEIYIARFLGGKAPKGGNTVAVHMINRLPEPKRTAIYNAAAAALELDI